MSRTDFEKVLSAVVDHDDYFKQENNCVGKNWIYEHDNVNAALRILACDLPPDAVEEYLAMSETTAGVTVKRFCSAVVEALGLTYLREPTDADIERMLKQSDWRCTTGLLGSIDCCKWECKNVPTAWHGKCNGKENKTIVTLEAISEHSCGSGMRSSACRDA